ncbi:MAG: hypothetical protein CFE34_13740 [Rhodobacteraceae bacterium PARR1]|nr:MAG: hypothetical protein CFE34_13740 [Rhodobacteraceae bacterium PARR1]
MRTLTSPTAVTIHSVFDSTGRRIAEYNQATGALIREYVWNGWEPVAVIEGGTVYLVRTDHIGRPVFATTTTGTQVWSASYLPFGGVRTATGALPTARFPGQWFQSESGLHQNWMRDYDPTTGRYIQADPLGLIDGASVYGYVRQNPGRWIDPRGEDAAALGTAIVRGVTMFGGTAAATMGAGIAGFLGILLYPSTLGDGTIPETQDAAGDEPQQCEIGDDGVERCKLILEKCRRNCTDSFEEGSFAGHSGADQFFGIRKCIRECMNAHDCTY